MNSGFVKALVDGLPHPAPAETIIRNGVPESDDNDIHISVSEKDYDLITCQQLGDVVPRSARCFGGTAVKKISGDLVGVEYEERLSKSIQINYVACVEVSTILKTCKLTILFVPNVCFHSVNVNHCLLPNCMTFPRIGIPLGPGGSFRQGLL